MPTLISLGNSAIAQVVPPRACTGAYVKYASGASLAIVGSATAGVTTGYVLGSTDIYINGPATFYLAAGAASVASVLFIMSAGYSQII